MSLRHAAALALVGWYLMLPPPNSLDPTSEPFPKWHVVGPFDSAVECKQATVDYYVRGEKLEAAAKSRFAQKHGRPFDPGPVGPPTGQIQRDFNELWADPTFRLSNAYESARCIATDDPRLKESSK